MTLIIKSERKNKERRKNWSCRMLEHIVSETSKLEMWNVQWLFILISYWTSLSCLCWLHNMFELFVNSVSLLSLNWLTQSSKSELIFFKCSDCYDKLVSFLLYWFRITFPKHVSSLLRIFSKFVCMFYEVSVSHSWIRWWQQNLDLYLKLLPKFKG